MQRASRISQCLSACYLDEAAHQLALPAHRSPVPEPMQVDSAHLSRMECVRRLAAGLCLYCAASDHFIRTCPVRPPRPAVSTIQLEPDISTLSLLPVQLLTSESSVSVSALVDSGSSGNFISQGLLTHLNLPVNVSPGRSESRQFKEKPLGLRRVKYRAPRWAWELDVCMRKPSYFWYWRDPPWTSSWDAYGSTNTLRKSDGIPVKLLDEARPVFTAVYPLYPSRARIPHKPKCVPPSSKASNLWWHLVSHLTTRHSSMYSASSQPPVFHCIGHGTVPSICCLGPNSPRVEYTLCPSQSARQWRNTSRRLFNRN